MEKTSKNIYRQIAAFKKEHESKIFRMTQLRGGHPPNPPKKKYADLNQRIRNIVLRYHQEDRLHYLRSIAYTMSF